MRFSPVWGFVAPAAAALGLDPSALFLNYDCVDVPVVPESPVDWDAVHAQLEAAASAGGVVLELGLLDRVFGENFALHHSQCPLGVLSLALLQAFRLPADAAATDGDRRAELLRWVRGQLGGDTPWHVVAQSRWPFFELLLNFMDGGEDAQGRLDACCRTTRPAETSASASTDAIMDWTAVQSAGRAFVEETGGEKKLVVAEKIGHLSNELFSLGNARIDEAMEQCMCGVVFLAAIQTLSAAARLSQFFPNWAAIIADFLAHVDFHEYVGGEWKILQVLVMFADLNKGDKYISYSASGDKLRRRFADLNPEVAQALRWPAPNNPNTDTRFLAAAREVIQAAATQMPQLMSGQDRGSATASRRNVVVYTLLYGRQWTALLGRAVKQLRRIGVEKLLVVTLGVEASDACSSGSGEERQVSCLEMPSAHGKSQIHRYTAAQLIVSVLGLDAFYFDLDTFFFQSPFPAIQATLRDGARRRGINRKSEERIHEGETNLLISSHADGNCVNVGFFYIKAEENSKEFLTIFVDWYHRHPYEIDQRGFDAFLSHSGTIGASFVPERIKHELVMHYAILDDVNQFVIPGVGWFGEAKDLVVAHFCEWEFERKKNDLDYLFAHAENATEIEGFFDKYKLTEPRERLECW